MTRRSLRGRLLVLLVALGAAAASYALVRRSGESTAELARHLDGGALVSDRTQAVERAWTDATFPRRYLPSPVEHLPCPLGIPGTPDSVRLAEAVAQASQGSVDDAIAELEDLRRRSAASYVPGLVLGLLLTREGRLTEAEVVLDEVLERRDVRETITRSLEAARANRPWNGSDPADVLAAVHLLHAAGYVGIESHREDGELWAVLRNPIGCAKLLSLRGQTDQKVRGTPTWAEHRLPSPGCETSADALTTLDLYNNLIVGYLRNENFRESKARRDREIARGYDDPPRDNPLLAVLRASAETLEPEREPWLWAVSNAERLLKERRRSGFGELTNPRLALNLAELMDSALASAPPEAHDPLAAQQRALVEVADRGRRQISARQRRAFLQALARQTLIARVRAGTPGRLDGELAEALEDEQRQTAAAVAHAVERRRQGGPWLALAIDGADDGGLRAALGERTADWLSASRQDLAATFALRAAGGTREERLRWIWRAKQVLTFRDPRPAELTAGEARLGFWRGLSWLAVLSWPAAELVFAALVGALTWVLASWLAAQLRRRHDLFTSFYRREAVEKLRRRP